MDTRDGRHRRRHLPGRERHQLFDAGASIRFTPGTAGRWWFWIVQFNRMLARGVQPELLIDTPG